MIDLDYSCHNRFIDHLDHQHVQRVSKTENKS